MNQMDQATQQNSALVEENAATAKTLENQAVAMTEKVAVFRLDGEARGAKAAGQEPASREPAATASARVSAAPATKPAANLVAKPTARPVAAATNGGPVGRMQSALATAIKDPEWEEF